MANNTEYTIVIKREGGSSDKNPVAGSNTEQDSGKSGGILSKQGAKNFAKGMVAYRTVKSFATQMINHEVSMVELRTGSNELQQRANFINEMHQKGVGILETTVTGALVGGLPGALVGLTLSTAHTLIGYSQNQQRLNEERAIENETIRRNIVRAGASNSRANQL